MSQINHLRNAKVLITFSFVLFALIPVAAIGQDNEAASQPEAQAIKKVEASGGRVYRISAADTSREISFALSDKPVGDEQLNGINAIKEVIWLNLAGTDITNDGLKHLAGMPLEKLHLERTKIGDEGLKHLKSFKGLTYLNLYDTKVTDAGLEHLKELKNLKKLYVWKSEVTESGMKQLNESLADLEIVGELKLVPVVIEEPKEEPKKKEDSEEKKEAEKKKEEPNKKKGNKKKDEPKPDADKPAVSDKPKPDDSP